MKRLKQPRGSTSREITWGGPNEKGRVKGNGKKHPNRDITVQGEVTYRAMRTNTGEGKSWP